MKYETLPGQHINDACKVATLLAIKNQCDVELEFNGVKLTAKPSRTPEGLQLIFDSKLKEQHEKYLQSGEHKLSEQKRQQELAQRQNIIDTQLIPSFFDIVKSGDLDNIMTWIKKFSNESDYIGLEYPKKDIADFLELNGFKENEYVGQSKDFFNTKENMARYIIGQVISCLRDNMPPHPITVKFVDDYFKL